MQPSPTRPSPAGTPANPKDWTSAYARSLFHLLIEWAEWGAKIKIRNSEDQARLKTSNSSLKSSTSTTSSSLVLAIREEVVALVTCDSGEAAFGIPSGTGSVAIAPSGIGLESRKPGVAMLICCSRGSQALMMHLGAWKLLDIRM